jgi:hypothetical protein
VYVGISVFEFTIDEKITKYISSVGNNCVPYPYAESLNWCYNMDGITRTPVSDHENREKLGSVFNKENAKYESFDIIEIASRDTDNMRYPARCSERTGYVRFKKSAEFCFIKNTCADETLTAVQYVNNMLSEQVSTNST